MREFKIWLAAAVITIAICVLLPPNSLILGGLTGIVVGGIAVIVINS